VPANLADGSADGEHRERGAGTRGMLVRGAHGYGRSPDPSDASRREDASLDLSEGPR